MPIITVTRPEAGIAVLTLDRPDMMNALGAPGDGDAVQAACDALNADLSLRCVILTGAGKAFSAGGDIKAMAAPAGPFSGPAIKIRDHYRVTIHRAIRALYGLDMPVVAAVNGAAIGLGCDIACLADVRIASDRAKFGVTFLKLGLIPGDGGAWLLPRTIGMSRAAELFFTGDVVDAATALDCGLVSKVVPHDSLIDEAIALARRIAMQPPHALRLTKALLRRGQTDSYDAALEQAAVAQAIAHDTQDHAEGLHALLEKRAPIFKGL